MIIFESTIQVARVPRIINKVDLGGSGWMRMNLDGSGWIWVDLDGSGWI